MPTEKRRQKATESTVEIEDMRDSLLAFRNIFTSIFTYNIAKYVVKGFASTDLIFEE
jgi:hypothetical protein